MCSQQLFITERSSLETILFSSVETEGDVTVFLAGKISGPYDQSIWRQSSYMMDGWLSMKLEDGIEFELRINLAR